MKRLSTILTVVLAVLLICSMALATVAWQKVFKTTYKPKPDSALAKAKCGACHMKATGGDLNPYGKALKGKAVNAASLKSVEGLDSDKDGKTNIAEIKAGTNPGVKQNTCK